MRAAIIFLLAALAAPAGAAEHTDAATSAAQINIAAGAAAAGDYATAAAYARRAAQSGDGAGLALLAEFHETGKGMPRDPARAAALYRSALDAGFGAAGARLGHLYARGIGVARDADAARHWFRHTALLLPAMKDRAAFIEDWMGVRGVSASLREAVAWADRVHGASATERYGLSVKYRTGKGATKDTAMADHLLAGAFYQGVPEADFDYGLALLAAYPGRAKIALGVDLLHTAAAAGLGEAQKALAMRHLAGKDVDRSDVAAWYWLHKAKASGAEVGRALHNLERYISAPDRKMAEWRLNKGFVPDVD